MAADKVVLTYFNGRGKMESIRWLLAAAGVEFEEVYLTQREQYEKLLKAEQLHLSPEEHSSSNMAADKVVLTYFNGRGKMESIRWLLAAAGVEFEEVYLTQREQYEKLLKDGDLMYEQVPLVEMDDMKMVQTKAILQYIAEKYNLHGNDIKDRLKVNMFCEGLMDLMEMIMILPFKPDSKPDLIQDKAKNRYLPVFEKALCGPVHLVGGRLSRADVHLLECSLMLEELFPGVLAEFPNVKSFQGRMMMKPPIKKFLETEGKRKPQPDKHYIQTVMEVLRPVFP